MKAISKHILLTLVTLCSVPSSHVLASNSPEFELATDESNALKSLSVVENHLDGLAGAYEFYGSNGAQKLTDEQKSHVVQIISHSIDTGELPNFVELTLKKDGENGTSLSSGAVAQVLDALIQKRKADLTDKIRLDPSSRAEINLEIGKLSILDQKVMDAWSATFMMP